MKMMQMVNKSLRRYIKQFVLSKYKIKQRKSLRNRCLKIIDYVCIFDNLIY